MAQQFTLDGGATPVKAPQASMTPSQKLVYGCIRDKNRGLTYKEIEGFLRIAIRMGKIHDTDRRVRELKNMGYLISHEGVDGQIRFYVAEGVS